MILVISGTNRRSSKTGKVAHQYFELLKQHQPDAKFLSLEDLPIDFISPDVYDNKSEAVIRIQKEFVNPAKKIVFILPEYNGGIPGILKLFMDVLDVKPAFNNKKAAMVGLSDGRNGNLLGLDSFTSVLHHLHITIMPQRVNIANLDKEVNDKGVLENAGLLQRLQKHVEQVIAF